MQDLTPFRQAAETSRVGFNALLGVVQNEINLFRQSKQLDRQLEMEKDLITFRLEEKDRIQGSRLQAQTQAQAEDAALKFELDQNKANLDANKAVNNRIPSEVRQHTANLIPSFTAVNPLRDTQIRVGENTLTLNAGAMYVATESGIATADDFLNSINSSHLPFARFVDTAQNLLMEDGFAQDTSLDMDVINKDRARELVQIIKTSSSLQEIQQRAGDDFGKIIAGGYNFNTPKTATEQTEDRAIEREFVATHTRLSTLTSQFGSGGSEIQTRNKWLIGPGAWSRIFSGTPFKQSVNFEQDTVGSILRKLNTAENSDLAMEMRTIIQQLVTHARRFNPDQVIDLETVRINWDVFNSPTAPQSPLHYFEFGPVNVEQQSRNPYDITTNSLLQ